jgi:glycosyltransferase involved in cell wall biosynthesis
MKIAIIIGLFPPKCFNGTEIASYYLAEHLAKRDHEIHVITSHDEGLSNFDKEKGFYVHRIAYPEIRIIGILLFWLKIFFKIREIKPEIVQAQDISMGIPAWVIKKILKIPYVVWGRGSDVYCPCWYVRLTTNPILRNANAILALTENMQNKLNDNYNTQIYVVPNGINLEEYTGLTINSKRDFGIKNILFVGRLKPVKGVEYLIIAMKMVHDKMPDARLILVGDGEEREYLSALSIQLGIQKYVQFVGKVPHEKVQDFMQQADIFVLPSLSEGFPNVVLEAMACGLPIVASRVGGIPDIITNDTNGYLVEVKDTENLSNKILFLLQNDILREKISGNNKKLVKEYSWEKVVVELEKIYELSIM